MIRRQTLKTGQRYTTVYLDELQHKVLGAQFELRRCEEALIAAARTRVVDVIAALQQVAEGIAWVDVYTSHALFALERKWVMPELVDVMDRTGVNGEMSKTDERGEAAVAGVMEIVGGRHPVIEAFLPHDQQFIPNDVAIG
jgi:DNA mismatch repair protein MutS